MERQLVICVWCKWRGPSPVKKLLKVAGRDYPVPCRQCQGIGLIPVEAYKKEFASPKGI